MASLANRPTLIETEDRRLRFLVLDAPSDLNLPVYLKEFRKYNVTHLVRVCQPTYNEAPIVQSGIKFYEMPFDDGKAPPTHIVTRWMELVDTVFTCDGGRAKKGKKRQKQQQQHADSTEKDDAPSTHAETNGTENAEPTVSGGANTDPPTIAVHCVAGLGRAPVLVAIALMEWENMDALDAIQFIRKRRRGAINTNQLSFIEKYVPRRKKANCLIM